MATTEPPVSERARDARLAIARHLAELHRLHIALAQDSRSLKRFTTEGHAAVEIEIASEMLEQYLGASDAFLENMRGRFEARLGLLRRGEPTAAGRAPDEVQGHGAFWYGFSRLCSVLKRVDRRTAG